MADKNLYQTADDTLRGESVGQLTPEAQGLWDKYNQVFGSVQGIPNRTLRLRSGATTQIPDPGSLMRQRALQKVLMGMSGTGLGTRATPQPGFLSQMAPFVTALGGDPKFQKWLAGVLGGNNAGGNGMQSGFDVGSSANDDWWSGMGDTGGDVAGDIASEIDWTSLADAGYW